MKTLIVAATICLPLLAGAQVLELTPDTACGAPGVGTVRVIRDGAERWVAEARHGTPGQRVGRDGRWHTGCQMPPACAARRTYQWADQQSGALAAASRRSCSSERRVGGDYRAGGRRTGRLAGPGDPRRAAGGRLAGAALSRVAGAAGRGHSSRP